MPILIRKHVTNGDKVNIWKETFEEALEVLGKQESDIATRVDWLNYEDVFFRDTSDYIRIINSKD